MVPVIKQVTPKQSEFLKGILSLWWNIPHTDMSYNGSVKILNKLLRRGDYELGGEDEIAIKHIMEFYLKYI